MTQRVRRVAILIIAILTTIGIIHIGTVWLFGASVFSSRSQQVRKLKAAFPTIEQYHVTATAIRIGAEILLARAVNSPTQHIANLQSL